MKKIIITEKQEKLLIATLIKESNAILKGQQEAELETFLDSHFIVKPGDNPKAGVIPEPEYHIWSMSNGKPVNKVYKKKLFYYLQERYSKLSGDQKERDKMIWDIINKWYQNKVSQFKK